MKQMMLLFKTVLSLILTSIYAQTLRYRLSTRDEGRLEVYHKHRWRPVCANTFGDFGARVLCFSLGFPRNCGKVVSNTYGRASGGVLQADFRCNGSESSLNECSYRHRNKRDAAAAHLCTHANNHVAVSCQQCHVAARRVRRNPFMPHNTNTETSSSNDGGNNIWMGGLFVFFFFSWVLVVTCCIICHCCRRRNFPPQDGPHAAQNIFMTPASGIDNAAMSSSQPDSLPLAGLPSYDDVVAHSDIYKRIDEDNGLPSYSIAVSQQSTAQHDSSDQT